MQHEQEQQQVLLEVLGNTDPPRTSMSGGYIGFRTILLLLLLIACGPLTVYATSRTYERSVNQESEKSQSLQSKSNFLMDSQVSHGYPMEKSISESTIVKDKRTPKLKSYLGRQKPELPENMGYINVYVRKPTPKKYRQSFERIRFPVARYRPHRFPLIGSLLSIMSWTNIYLDPFSRQTIIYSPTKSIYILPPLINAFDQVFSIAELIASGYASLASNGIRPISIIDLKAYFKQERLIGRYIPKIEPSTGCFIGGIRTNYGSFIVPKYPETHIDIYSSSESMAENTYSRRRPIYPKGSKSNDRVKQILQSDSESTPTGITRIVINSPDDPVAPSEKLTFGGRIFGNVGAYEKLRGVAYGQLNPNDKHNSLITDLKLAPRNKDDMVEYSMDFYILKPVNMSNSNHKLFFEVNNRGNKLFGSFAQSSGGNNPTITTDGGQAFLMNQGYTIAWSGWDPSVAPTGNADLLRIYLPIAINSDGSSITGPNYEYISFDNPTSTSYTTSYYTNSFDTTKATLTMRNHLTDSPVIIQSTNWMWTSNNTIALLPVGTAFKQSWIYELVYTAKDPYVAGIGFAATRDFVSFLRSRNTENPLNGQINQVLSWSLSQPARYMNDFIWLNFNEDLSGKQIFDGVFNWIGAGSGIGLNYRFAQPTRTERNRENHLYPEAPFPFSYTSLTDPVTRQTDGRSLRCAQKYKCPKIMNILSANEYWVKTGSLLHSDLAGNDIMAPSNVRNYLLAGTQHSGTSPANSFGICKQFGNTIDPNPVLRALFIALVQWLDGTEPPPSMVPCHADRTAVLSNNTIDSPLGIGQVPQASLNWPNIPDVLYTGLVTVRSRLYFGPQFSNGIITVNPPRPTGYYYSSFVSAIDADGNELAGIRCPPVAVPVATYTGWNLRSSAFGGNDGCEGTGSSIPFAPDETSRRAKNDPRLSLAERYGNRSNYEAAVADAVNALVKQRLLLAADAQAYVAASQQPIQVINNPTYGSYTW